MGRAAKLKVTRREAPKPLRLDLGCGQNPRDGFLGVDRAETEEAFYVADLMKFPWDLRVSKHADVKSAPLIGLHQIGGRLPDGVVAEVYCSHFFEHIPGPTRFSWMDELWRVLKPPSSPGAKDGGTATILVPYYSSMRAVQDPTHAWPPVCEASFLYFNRQWRVDNKLDHYPVSCDFDFTFGHALAPDVAMKNDEARAFALGHYINAAADLQVILTKRG